MYGDKDVHYDPEAFGLTVIDSIDYSSGNYEFDIRIVWKHTSGKFYTARDSGCSCPSPFEGYTSLDKLDELNFEELKKEVDNELKSEYRNISKGDAESFLEAVESSL